VGSPDRLFLATGMWAAGKSETDSRASSAPSEDGVMIARVQAGDEAALGILLDRYAPLVISLGSRILRDHGEAQELVQDVFLHVYRKCHLFDPKKGSFRSWLIQVASHRAFDRREYLNLHRFYDDRNLDDFEGCHVTRDIPSLIGKGGLQCRTDGRRVRFSFSKVRLVLLVGLAVPERD